MVTDHFDEGRYSALLDLAGPEVAAELAQRLDEDLTRVDLALGQGSADTFVLHTQSHILLAIAGTIGANQVYDLAQRLNQQVRGGDSAAALAQTLGEVRLALQVVIARVRSTRFDMEQPS